MKENERKDEKYKNKLIDEWIIYERMNKWIKNLRKNKEMKEKWRKIKKIKENEKKDLSGRFSRRRIYI